jgi:hypothetical protein
MGVRADEVDRLERKVATTADFYGRSNPKPTPPNFDAEDMRKMRAAEAVKMLRAREHADDEAWREIQVPTTLGLEFERYKWRQNQSFVELFVKLPPGSTKADVEVEFDTTRISVRVLGDVVVRGALCAAIKVELSTWVIGTSVSRCASAYDMKYSEETNNHRRVLLRLAQWIMSSKSVCSRRTDVTIMKTDVQIPIRFGEHSSPTRMKSMRSHPRFRVKIIIPNMKSSEIWGTTRGARVQSL